jgi:hypothetical protein
MRKEHPINTAPLDGTKIMVLWIDEDDQKNESVAQFRNLDKLKLSGGDWDESDAGWWIFTDSKTQKKIEPILWISENEDD